MSSCIIPYVVPPLHGLRVLVTRPAEQAARLSELIVASGGEACVFPSLATEAIPPLGAPAHTTYEWVVFVSANAVRHAAPHLPVAIARKVVAIGHATARALEEHSWPVHLVPPTPHTSETLLGMPEFDVAAMQRVLIVRGEGGREQLGIALGARGASVESFIVYRRVPANHSDEARAALEREWQDSGIDIVTATSAETLTHLHDQLGPVGRELLGHTPLLVASSRIADSARAMGLRGDCVLAPAADDASLVGAMSHWFARAR